MTDDDLKRLIEGLRQENSALHAETRRHFDVALEAAKHETRLVAEGIAAAREAMDRRATALEERMERGFAETQAMVKFSHAELDRRIRTLEDIVSNLLTRVERLESSTN